MSKLISVSNEVYAALKARKNGRSFSEVIISLCGKPTKTPLDVLKGWKPSEKLLKGIEDSYAKRKERKLSRVDL